ncbi:MAG: response regulator [Candidatus Omnitrophota bacterium]
MGKILIIQDSHYISKILTFKLKVLGFASETAITGTEGLGKARTGEYQLILLDYTLPDIDGGSICKLLKNDPATEKISVLFVSAKDDSELDKITEETNADGWISMPFEGQDFEKKVSKFAK